MQSYQVVILLVAAVACSVVAGYDFGGHEAFQGHEEYQGHEGYQIHEGYKGHGGFEEHEEHVDYHAHPKYSFDYSVKDPHTGDNKDHWETRDGDKVKGSYSLLEADGTKRVVEYESDKHNGFNAVVHKIGKPIEHQPAHEYAHKYEAQDFGHEGHYGY